MFTSMIVGGRVAICFMVALLILTGICQSCPVLHHAHAPAPQITPDSATPTHAHRQRDGAKRNRH